MDIGRNGSIGIILNSKKKANVWKIYVMYGKWGKLGNKEIKKLFHFFQNFRADASMHNLHVLVFV